MGSRILKILRTSKSGSYFDLFLLFFLLRVPMKLLLASYLLVIPVLVNRPHGRHVLGEQLGERGGWRLVARPRTNEPRLSHGRVADDDAFDELLVRLLKVHRTSSSPWSSSARSSSTMTTLEQNLTLFGNIAVLIDAGGEQ